MTARSMVPFMAFLGFCSFLLHGCSDSDDTVRDPCSTTSETCCPRADLAQKSARCSDVLKDGAINPDILVVGGDSLPEQLQGVFWLTEQGASSSLMSFGQSNDGCGMSQGTLSEGKDSYEVRVTGDRAWSFSDDGTAMLAARLIDLAYVFQITEGGTSDPHHMQIIPKSIAVAKLRLEATWIMDFDMKLLVDDNDRFKYNRADWNGSVVWGRPSSFIGFDIKSKFYLLVQVADGKGTPVQPAFDQWLAFCNSDPDAGSTPGYFHYFEATNTPDVVVEDDKEVKIDNAATCCEKTDGVQACLDTLEEAAGGNMTLTCET